MSSLQFNLFYPLQQEITHMTDILTNPSFLLFQDKIMVPQDPWVHIFGSHESDRARNPGIHLILEVL